MKLSYQTHKVDFIFFNEIQLLYNVVLVSAVQQSKSAMLLLRRFSRVQLCATPQTAAHQAPRPWDSPGKNTGVDCHFLLQCMKVKRKSFSRVQLFTTPQIAAHQAPPSMGISRQEYWSGVPLPSPISHLFQISFPFRSPQKADFILK